MGLEYKGIEGLGLQGHLSFPAPDPSELGTFFSALNEFFSSRKYLLDPKKSPGIALKMTLGDNYIELPEYLGGKVLGIKGQPVTINIWSGIAHGLNFMKTISINELIQTIPINSRMGSADSSFGFLSFNADWMISTPKEFRDSAYKKMKLSASDKEDFVAVLPTVAASASSGSGNEEGLIIFMRAEVDLAVVKMETVFGLAASGSGGFATGFKFTGTLAQIIEMEIDGAVAINAPEVDPSGSVSFPEAPALPAADIAELPVGTPLALACDGSTSYVTVPDHGRLNLSGSPFTIEAWINVHAFDKDWQTVISKGTNSWRLSRYGNSNKIAFATTGLSNVALTSIQALNIGQWYHIAAVYTGSKKQLYINGELDNEVNVTGTLATSNYHVMIGENAQVPGRVFNGAIAEVRIWGKARTDASLQSTMYQKLSGKEADLLSNWRFDRGYGATAVDVCGTNHGVMHAPAWQPTNRLQLDGISFNGKNSYMQWPEAEIDFSEGLTIEAWVYYQSFKKWSRIFESGNGSNDGILLANDGTDKHLTLIIRKGSASKSIQAKKVLTAKKWMHIAATIDSEGQARLYVNGERVKSGDVHPPTTILRTKNYLGRSYQDGKHYFHGKLDEVRLWNTVRSQAEITNTAYTSLSGEEEGLAACWSFRRGFGTVVEDRTENYSGTLVNASWSVANNTGTAATLSGLRFDGEGSTVDVADHPNLRISEYTLECWVKPEKPTAWVGIAGKLENNYNIWLGTLGNVQHRFRRSNGTVAIVGSGNGRIKYNKWNHIAITNDGSTARVFINGREIKAGATGGTVAINNTSLVMGRHLDGSNKNYYKGLLADVRLWSVARDAAAIQGTMLKRLTGKETGLKAWWPMDEGGGEHLRDHVADIDGLVTQAHWPEKTKMLPQGLYFDGTDDSVQVPDHSTLQITDYTVECWIKPEQDKDIETDYVGVIGKPGRNFNIWLHKDAFIHHRFKVGDKTNVGPPNTAKGSIKWGEWNHVAITNDSKTAKTYINGVLAASGDCGVPAMAATPVIIGRRLDDGNSNFYKGYIDEIRIWSKARTANQIQSTMYRSLKGNESGLCAYWKMNKGYGNELVDASGNGNTGLIDGAGWSMISAPKEPKTAAVQIFGHTHLDMLGHRILEGDVRLIDDSFWFRGMLNLFPDSWPVKVYGDVEGLINKGDFRISGEVETALAGLKLSSSKFLATNSYIRVEGTLFGTYAILEVFNKSKKTALKGTVGFDYNVDIHFGIIKIAKTKVADKVKINTDIHFEMAIELSQSGFSADVDARFEINGKGFDLSFKIKVTPNDIGDVLDAIKKEITGAPLKYLGDMFSDAGKWLENVGSGAIEFFDDVGDATGKALAKGFKAADKEMAKLMKGAGHDVGKVGKALKGAFKSTAGAAGKALKEAGFDSGNVGKALRGTFTSKPDVAAKALKGAGFVAADVGKALKGSFSSDIDKASKALKDAGFSSADVGKGLKGAYTNSATTAAKALKGVGFVADDVGKGLKSAFTSSGATAAKALKSAGFVAADVGKGLKNAYNSSADAAAKALKGAGFVGADVGKALKGAYNSSVDAAAKALKDAGFSSSDVGKGLKEGFDSSADAAAKALKGAGFVADDIGKGLKGGFNSSADAAAKALKGAGFGSGDIGKVLKGSFTSSDDVAAKALKDIGFGVDDVGNVLKNFFSNHSEVAGLALSRAGFPANEVGKVLKGPFGRSGKQVAGFMKRSLNMGSNAVKKALKGAGFSASKIENALKDIFG